MTSAVPVLRLARGRLGGRVVLATADQLVSSASNFAVSIAVVRFAGLPAFGRYLILYTVWLAVAGIHRALVAEPMVIVGRGRDGDRRIAAGLGAEVVLGLALSAVAGVIGLAVLAAGSSAWGWPLLAMAASLTPLVVQDYWRQTAFRRNEPGVALANDVLFAVVQAAAFALVVQLGPMSTTGPVLAWGAGALAGAVVGAVTYQVWPLLREGVRLLRTLSGQGRWLLADFGTSFASDQLAPLLVAAALTELEYGRYRASWALMGPLMVMYLAVGNLSLPEAASRYRQGGLRALRRFADRVSLAVAAMVLVYLLVFAVVGDGLARVAFGVEDEVGSLTMPALTIGAGFVATAAVYGRVHAVKVTGHIRRLWVPRLVLTVFSVVVTLLLALHTGVEGAAIGVAVSGVAYLVTVLYVARTVFGAGDARTVPGPGEDDPGTASPPTEGTELRRMRSDVPPVHNRSHPSTLFSTLREPS